MNPIIVLLDTTTLDSANYSFHNGALESLRKYCERGDVELWIGNITVREAQRHIRNKVIEAAKEICDDKRLLVLKSSAKYRLLFALTDENMMLKAALGEFKSFLRKSKAKILGNGGVAINSVLDDYFNEQPPFCGGKKKAEFPDAITIAKVKKLLTTIDEIHIISADKDWKKAFENDRKAIVHNSTKDFLDCLNRKDKIRNKVIDFVTTATSQNYVKVKITELLEDADINVNGLEYDRKGIIGGYDYDEINEKKVTEVRLKLDAVEYIDESLSLDASETVEGTIKISMQCQAEMKVQCTFFDEANSIWDSEDKDYMFRSEGTADEVHEVEFIVELEISARCASGEEPIFDIGDTSITDFPTELDGETLVGERKYKTESFDDDWDDYNDRFSVENTYKCPKCGTEIKVDLMKSAECVSSTERQMGTENEYEIECDDQCQNCGENYRIKGKIYEYPILILNNDSSKIKWGE